MKFLMGIVMACLCLPSSAWAVLDVDAGPDVTLECEGQNGTRYTLNGSVPAEDGLTFEWTTDPEVVLHDDDTLTPTGSFPLGESIVQLTANTELDSGEDSVTVTVEDSTPPVVRARVRPYFLWPPNHQMREVEVRLRIDDSCASAEEYEVELVSVTSNEPDNGKGDGNTVDDIQDADIGSDDRNLLLRAERSGNGDGRIYTLTYRVSDASGNATDVEATVHVPHDASALRDLIAHRSGDRGEFEPICPLPADAAEQFLSVVPSVADFGSLNACVKACRTWSNGCLGIIGGAQQCVRSEVKSVLALEKQLCNEEDNRGERRRCANNLRREQRSSRNAEHRENAKGRAICADAASECVEMCNDYAFIEPFVE